jgi:hypothetical protein
MPIRLAASLAAAALLCAACSGPKEGSQSTAASPAAVPTASPVAAPVPSGPANALVSRIGTPGAIPLDPQQRREVAAAAAKAAPDVRPRLRYALASGEDGKIRLVVYDGEGLPADGRHPGKPHEYVVFKVLNAARSEHYDPQQNVVVAPIPPPAQRDSLISGR